MYKAQNLQFPNVGVSGGPPEGTCVVHQGKDELLKEQNAIPDEEIASPV